MRVNCVLLFICFAFKILNFSHAAYAP